MKSFTLAVLLSVLCLQFSNAQRRNMTHNKQNWDKQRVFWGYYLGLNSKNFDINSFELFTGVDLEYADLFAVFLR